jgi:hypothetical protein
VRTRTLLLLAVGCGLAILVAGAVLLLRVTNQDEVAAAVAIGDTARVGDMEIVVERSSERDGRVLVDIEIGGVDDPDGAGPFRLVVPSGALEADPSAGNHCGATTVRVEPCTLAFRLGDDSGSTRVLLYQRGDERVRWDLPE